MNKTFYFLLILAITGIAQANLITNGDFADGNANWPETGSWGGQNLSFANGELYMDSNEANLENPEDYGAFARSERFSVYQGMELGYSIDYATWVSATPQTEGYLFRIQCFDDQGDWVGDIVLEEITEHTGFGWNTLTGQFTVDFANVAEAAVELSNGVYNSFNGAVKVDNIALFGPSAWDPVPENGAQDVGTVQNEACDVDLSWKTGLKISDPTITDPNIVTHYVYLNDGSGWTLQDDVNADGPTGTYTLTGLSFNKQYLWRIDEGVTLAGGGVSGPEDPETIQGPVWSFGSYVTLSIIEQPETVVADSGSDVDFTVAAETLFDSTISYQWYKSADDVVDDGDQALTSEAALTLTDVDLTDEAFYYCAVSSGSLTLHSDVVSLGIRRKLAHWSLDDSDYTENQYIDLTSSGIDAAVGGTPEFVDGFVNGDQDPNTLKANGAVKIYENDGWADAGAFNPAEYSDQFTVSGWFKWTQHSDPSVDWNVLVSKRDDWTSNDDNMFMVLVDGPAKQLVMQSWGDGYVTSGQDSVQPNEWYHFAAVYTGEVGRVYLNGQFAGESDYPMQGGEDSTFYIGRIGDDIGQRFDGALDDIQVYNYALSSEHIAGLYQDETGETLCLKDLVWYDLTGDCAVNMDDFMVMVTQWLDSGMYPAE
ncbi:LamG-like jellyroll fold domain-containing protein [Sedimentisphaera salicampi]|uniref:LamG-like jellyroll fold domain-containing protein n=1 Tax=Sedimentisphaera salicampi TaxID=1941349 RepID=UPI000B9B8232|nr:LamG-like jellyroll fold domain-containing protein [Sedimentisphaera salicampi]OXU15535.1 hypothetical protein SMSP1_00617 [Sedimentisphaera salicampi]